jgi:hypothetical protein
MLTGTRIRLALAAVITSAALSSCAHRRTATAANQEVWEVTNRSQCTAFVDFGTRHGKIMNLGKVPSGATQTFRVAPVPGGVVSALSLEEDGTTGCGGGMFGQMQVKVRKLEADG